MSILEKLETIEKDGWLDSIDSFHLETMKEMGLNSSNPDEIAKKWLNASTSLTAPFGVEKTSKPFLDNLRRELLKLICDEDSYPDIKEKLKEIPGGDSALIVGVISTGIAANVDASAAFISPIVSLILYSFGKIVKNAFCQTYYFNGEE